jgi:hypothetical protein
MDTSILWQAAWWLLEWAAIIGVSILALIVAVKIAVETWRKISFHLELMLEEFAYRAAEKLTKWILHGIWITVFLIGFTCGIVFWPLSALLRLAIKQQPKQDAPKPPPPQSGDPLKEARDILGLHNEFSAADLKERHRELMKRVHTDVGGTDWLAQRVNWAHDILKGSAAR